jgi:hypothetical protein
MTCGCDVLWWVLTSPAVSTVSALIQVVQNDATKETVIDGDDIVWFGIQGNGISSDLVLLEEGTS